MAGLSFEESGLGQLYLGSEAYIAQKRAEGEALIAEQQRLLNEQATAAAAAQKAESDRVIEAITAASAVPQVGSTTSAAPTPADTPAPAESKPGTEAYITESYLATSYLPKQTIFPWVRTAKDFLALPTEKRKELIDDAVSADAKAKGWTAEQTAEVRTRQHQYLTFGEFKNNRAPTGNWILGSDPIDKAWASGRDLVSKVVQALPGIDDIGQIEFRKSKIAEDAASFSEYTRDQDKFAAFRANQAAAAKARGEVSTMGQGFANGVSGAFADLRRNPLAKVGELLPTVAPSIVAAVATGGMSTIAQVGAQAATGVVIGTPSALTAQFDEIMALPEKAFLKDKDYITQIAQGKSPAQAKAFVAGRITYTAENAAISVGTNAAAATAGGFLGAAALARGAGKVIGTGAAPSRLARAGDASLNLGAEVSTNMAQSAADKYFSNRAIDNAMLDTPRLGTSGVAEAAGESVVGALLSTGIGAGAGALRSRLGAGRATPAVTAEAPTAVNPGVTATITPAPANVIDAIRGRQAETPSATPDPKVEAAQVAAGKAEAAVVVGRVETPVTPVDAVGKTMEPPAPKPMPYPGVPDDFKLNAKEQKTLNRLLDASKWTQKDALVVNMFEAADPAGLSPREHYFRERLLEKAAQDKAQEYLERASGRGNRVVDSDAESAMTPEQYAAANRAKAQAVAEEYNLRRASGIPAPSTIDYAATKALNEQLRVDALIAKDFEQPAPQAPRTMAAEAAPLPTFRTESISVPAPNAPPAPAPAVKPTKAQRRDIFSSLADVEAFTDPTKPLTPETRTRVQDHFDAQGGKRKSIDRATVEQLGGTLADLSAPSLVAKGMTHGEVLSRITSARADVMARAAETTPSGLPMIEPLMGGGYQANTPAGPRSFPTEAAMLRAISIDPMMSAFLPDNVATRVAQIAKASVEGKDVPDAALPDTLFATDKVRGGTQGSAVKQADGSWKAEYAMPDGSINYPPTPDQRLPTYHDAEAWLQSQEPTAVVDRRQVGSGQVNMLTKRLHEADMATPHSSRVFYWMKAMQLSDQHALAVAQKVLNPFDSWSNSRLGQMFKVQERYADRLGALDRLVGRNMANLENVPLADQPAVVMLGSDRARQNIAKGLGETRSGGAIDRTLADISSTMASAKLALHKAGLGDATYQNIGYALTEPMRNEITAKAFPTDLRGNAKDGDPAKFSYFVDSNGRLYDGQAGEMEAAPPGLTKVSGVGSGDKYLAALAAQQPELVPVMAALAEAIKEFNGRVTALRVQSGRISEKQAALERQHEFYVPLRQLENTQQLKSIRSTGRSSSAVSPLDQLIIHGFAESSAAYRAMNVKDFGEMLKYNPAPDIATINSAEKKLRPAKVGDAESDHIWGTDNKFGDDAISYWVGNDEFAITLHDPAFKTMFRPDASNAVRDFLLPKMNMLNRAWSLTRTGVEAGFALKTALVWDPILVTANVQGAAGRNSKGEWFIPLSSSLLMPLKIMRSAFGELAYSGKQSTVEAYGNNVKFDTTNADDLVRARYAQEGGGISLHAEQQYTVASGLTRSTTGAERKVSGLGRSTVNALGTAIDLGASIGHISPAAIRLAAYKEFVKLHNGGKLPDSPAAWKAWDTAKPEEAQAAIKYSKEILGNFERSGTAALTRSFLPFFNAGVQGVYYTVPQILSSPHGLIVLGAIMAAAAGAAFNGKETMEKDADGKYKHFRKEATWGAGVVVGDGPGSAVPLPHDVKTFANLATWATAHGMHLAGDDGVDIDFVNKKMMRAFVDLLPIKPSPFEGSGVTTVFNNAGWFLDQTMGRNGQGKDFGTGQAVGNYKFDEDGNSVKVSTAGVVDDAFKYGARNSAFQVDAAKTLNRITGGVIDATPDAIKSIQQQVMGSYYGYANAYQKAFLESGGDETAAWSAALAYVGRNFDSKHNEYAVGNDFRTAEKDASRDSITGDGAPLVDGYRTQDQITINDVKKQISKLRADNGMSASAIDRAMGHYREIGNAAGYKTMFDRKELIKKEVALIQGATVKMLDDVVAEGQE